MDVEKKMRYYGIDVTIELIPVPEMDGEKPCSMSVSAMMKKQISAGSGASRSFKDAAAGNHYL